LKRFLIILMSSAVIGTATILGINAHVKNIGGSHIITAKVKHDRIPCDMLAGELKTSIELYKQGSAPKIINSQIAYSFYHNSKRS